MPSEFEDTTVDEIDYANLSDEQLQDIVDNDDRVTAQDGAQAELNRREADNSDSTDNAEGLSAQDVKERNDPQPEAPVKDSAGYETSPASEDLGAGQVQYKMDQATTSGTWPGDGEPPAGDHTLAAVTQIPQHADQPSGTDPTAPAEDEES